MKFSKINQSVPDVNRVFVSGSLNYGNSSVIAGNSGVIRNIDSNYGSFIQKWGNVFEIDKEILIGFIATESGGTNAPPNQFQATGLMQMTPGAVAESVPKFKVYGVKQSIPTEAVNYLNKNAPFITALKRDVPLTSANKSKILDLLKNNSEMNIMLGALYLRFLLEMFSKAGNAYLNKAMVAYNAGAYIAVLNPDSTAMTTASLASNKKVPLESRAYLLKMLGVNGFLDLIINKNVV